MTAHIALYRPKTPSNIGGTLRAAMAFGAKSVLIQGRRDYRAIRHAANTTKTERTIPVIFVDDLFKSLPISATPVAVELMEGAVQLPEFNHPKNAVYLFGPEDGSLPELGFTHKVFIPSAVCLNLAMCVNVVMYDRCGKLSNWPKWTGKPA